MPRLIAIDPATATGEASTPTVPWPLQAFLVVQQDLQEMFGGETLVAFAQGQALGSLNEAARTLGVFLEIHSF